MSLKFVPNHLGTPWWFDSLPIKANMIFKGRPMNSKLHLRHFCVWEIINPNTISGPKRKTEFQEYKWSGVGETSGA